MEKAVEFFRDQMRGIRYGEISTGLIDTIRAEAYGQRVPIKHIAWTVPDKNRILVSPYDTQLLGAIDKALKAEGFNSYVFSKTQVVVSLPIRSLEDRDRVVQQINKLAEEARVSIRNIRKKIRQKADANIDKPLQQLTDEKIKEINDLVQLKVDSL